MTLIISLSAIFCFSILAGVSLLRLWLNHKQRNILNYDSAYQDEKNSRIDEIPKRFAAMSIHNYSKMLFGFGMMVSAGLALMAFSWQTTEEQDLSAYAKPIMEEEIFELPPLTDIPPPPPPKVQPISPTEIVEVDKIDIEDNLIEINIEDPEINIKDIVTDVTSIDRRTYTTEKIPEIFEIVEEPAVFEGGMDNFYKYIAKNIKYPKQARRQGVEGKVFLRFVVDKKGKITDVEVTKSLGFGLDEEAKRVLMESPKWTPARQRGKVVKVRMNIPIMFKLD